VLKTCVKRAGGNTAGAARTLRYAVRRLADPGDVNSVWHPGHATRPSLTMRISMQRAYRRPPNFATSSSSWSSSASRRYSWTTHATGTLGAQRNRSEWVLTTVFGS
jgi:hypothetical protein